MSCASALVPLQLAWEDVDASPGDACGSSLDAARGAAKMELLRQCQRQVAGSLDDVVGHE
jgi:hypothetical protein